MARQLQLVFRRTLVYRVVKVHALRLVLSDSSKHEVCHLQTEQKIVNLMQKEALQVSQQNIQFWLSWFSYFIPHELPRFSRARDIFYGKGCNGSTTRIPASQVGMWHAATHDVAGWGQCNGATA